MITRIFIKFRRLERKYPDIDPAFVAVNAAADDQDQPQHGHSGQVDEGDEVGKDVVVEIEDSQKNQQSAAYIDQSVCRNRNSGLCRRSCSRWRQHLLPDSARSARNHSQSKLRTKPLVDLDHNVTCYRSLRFPLSSGYALLVIGFRFVLLEIGAEDLLRQRRGGNASLPSVFDKNDNGNFGIIPVAKPDKPGMILGILLHPAACFLCR